MHRYRLLLPSGGVIGLKVWCVEVLIHTYDAVLLFGGVEFEKA
jgi:hypothetical protein